MPINYNEHFLLFLKTVLAALFIATIICLFYIQHTIKVRRIVRQKIATKRQQDAMYIGVWAALGLLTLLVWVINW
jgi:hypothetical protein